MAITNGYCTLAQLKSWVGIGTADTSEDAKIELAIEAASRMIDADCDRVFYNAGTAVRYFTPTSATLCDIDDAISITEVASDYDGTLTYPTVWAASDFVKEPLNNLSAGRPWPTTRLRAVQDNLFTRLGEEPTVKVTATWGFSTAVPVEITQATLILAARVAKRSDSVLGVAGFGEMGALRVARNDPDYQHAIARYMRNKVSSA